MRVPDPLWLTASAAPLAAVVLMLIAASSPLSCDTAATLGPAAPAAPERTGVITRAGKPLTLIGPELKVGDPAPDFALLRTDMTEARLADFAGKTLIVATVPSLDTPVCSVETERFNREAAAVAGVTILVVSRDLPFAQARWCGAHDVKNVVTLSDFRTGDFGRAWGVLVKENSLLARTVFVVDAGGRLRYVQRVADITHEPDYDAALAAAREAG
jgi:thiol peroxidase